MNWLYGWEDSLDQWLAADKFEHLVGGMLCGALLWIAGASLLAALAGVLVVGILVEAVELTRYRVWVRKKQPQPWPWLTDKVSPKDLVVDVLGGLLGWCAAALAGRIGLWF
jgi:hypothetical protein